MRGLALALVALMLTGCSNIRPDAEDDTSFDKVEVEGTTCVVARGYRSVSLDCDWGR